MDRCSLMGSLFLALLPSQTAPLATAKGQLLSFIFFNLLISFYLLLLLTISSLLPLSLISDLLSLFIYTIFYLHFVSFGNIHPLTVIITASFFGHGLQEEWVSTCQWAQVCSFDNAGASSKHLCARTARCQPQGNNAGKSTMQLEK